MNQSIIEVSENGDSQTSLILAILPLQTGDQNPHVFNDSTPLVLTEPSWEDVVGVFLAAGVDSAGTRRAYARHLKRAGIVFGNVPLSAIDGMLLAEFRVTVMGSELSPSTQAQMLSALRSFLSWTGSMGGHQLSSDMVAKALRTPRATVRTRYTVITEKEIAAMLTNAPGPRERAILGVLLGAGLRVAETAHLAVSDIVEDLDGGVALFVRQGKGRKDRVVPIGAEVDRLLRAYLVDSHRFLGEAGPLFLAKDRGAASRNEPGLSTRSLGRLVAELAKGAGIAAKRVTPHSLRHTYAIRCLRAGGNVVAVGKLLGHASIATTQRYVDHLAVSELRAAVPALPFDFPDELAS